MELRGLHGYTSSLFYWSMKNDRRLATALLALFAALLREPASNADDSSMSTGLRLGVPPGVCANLRRGLATDLSLLLGVACSRSSGTAQAPPPLPSSADQTVVTAIAVALVRAGTLHGYSRLLSAAATAPERLASDSKRLNSDLGRALDLLQEVGELLHGLAGAVVAVDGPCPVSDSAVDSELADGAITGRSGGSSSSSGNNGSSGSSSGNDHSGGNVGSSPSSNSSGTDDSNGNGSSSTSTADRAASDHARLSAPLPVLFASQLAASQVLEHTAQLALHVVRLNNLSAAHRQQIIASLRGLSAALHVLTRPGWVAAGQVAEVTSGPCMQWLLLAYGARLFSATAGSEAEVPKLRGVGTSAVRLPMWNREGKVVSIIVPPRPAPAAAPATTAAPPPAAPPTQPSHTVPPPAALKPQYVSSELVVQSLRAWRARLSLSAAAAATATAAGGGDGGILRAADADEGPLLSKPELPYECLSRLDPMVSESATVMEPGFHICYIELFVLESLSVALQTAPELPPGIDCRSVAARVASEAMRRRLGDQEYPPQHWAYEGGALEVGRYTRECLHKRIFGAEGRFVDPHGLVGLFQRMLAGELQMQGSPPGRPLAGASPGEVVPRLLEAVQPVVSAVVDQTKEMRREAEDIIRRPDGGRILEALALRTFLMGTCDRLGRAPAQVRLLFPAGMRLARLGTATWGCPSAQEDIIARLETARSAAAKREEGQRRSAEAATPAVAAAGAPPAPPAAEPDANASPAESVAPASASASGVVAPAAAAAAALTIVEGSASPAAPAAAASGAATSQPPPKQQQEPPQQGPQPPPAHYPRKYAVHPSELPDLVAEALMLAREALNQCQCQQREEQREEQHGQQLRSEEQQAGELGDAAAPSHDVGWGSQPGASSAVGSGGSSGAANRRAAWWEALSGAMRAAVAVETAAAQAAPTAGGGTAARHGGGCREAASIPASEQAADRPVGALLEAFAEGRCEWWGGNVAGEKDDVAGALPPHPSLEVAAALSAGVVPCAELLLRCRGRSQPRDPRSLRLVLRPLLGRHSAGPARQLLAFGEPRQVAALMATTAKMLRLLEAGAEERQRQEEQEGEGGDVAGCGLAQQPPPLLASPSSTEGWRAEAWDSMWWACRLLLAAGMMPPAEAERRHHNSRVATACGSGTRGGVEGCRESAGTSSDSSGDGTGVGVTGVGVGSSGRPATTSIPNAAGTFEAATSGMGSQVEGAEGTASPSAVLGSERPQVPPSPSLPPLSHLQPSSEELRRVLPLALGLLHVLPAACNVALQLLPGCISSSRNLAPRARDCLELLLTAVVAVCQAAFRDLEAGGQGPRPEKGGCGEACDEQQQQQQQSQQQLCGQDRGASGGEGDASAYQRVGAADSDEQAGGGGGGCRGGSDASGASGASICGGPTRAAVAAPPAVSCGRDGDGASAPVHWHDLLSMQTVEFASSVFVMCTGHDFGPTGELRRLGLLAAEALLLLAVVGVQCHSDDNAGVLDTEGLGCSMGSLLGAVLPVVDGGERLLHRYRALKARLLASRGKGTTDSAPLQLTAPTAACSSPSDTAGAPLQSAALRMAAELLPACCRRECTNLAGDTEAELQLRPSALEEAAGVVRASAAGQSGAAGEGTRPGSGSGLGSGLLCVECLAGTGKDSQQQEQEQQQEQQPQAGAGGETVAAAPDVKGAREPPEGAVARPTAAIRQGGRRRVAGRRR